MLNIANHRHTSIRAVGPVAPENFCLQGRGSAVAGYVEKSVLQDLYYIIGLASEQTSPLVEASCQHAGRQMS